MNDMMTQIDAVLADLDDGNDGFDINDPFGDNKRHAEMMAGFGGFQQLAQQQVAALMAVTRVMESMAMLVRELTLHQAEATAALREATAALKAPRYGEIVRDEKGKVTGTVSRSALN